MNPHTHTHTQLLGMALSAASGREALMMLQGALSSKPMPGTYYVFRKRTFRVRMFRTARLEHFKCWVVLTSVRIHTLKTTAEQEGDGEEEEGSAYHPSAVPWMVGRMADGALF